jgi:GDP-L-fucose synthase
MAWQVEVWGSGNARREFLHTGDLADALLFLADHYSGPEHINVGFGSDLSIKELAEIIKDVSGFRGELFFNTAEPEGAMRKLLDHSKLFAMGWRPKIELRKGIETLYQSYGENVF